MLYKYQFKRLITGAFFHMNSMPYPNDTYLVIWYAGRRDKPRCRYVSGLRAARQFRNDKRAQGTLAYITTDVLGSPCYE